MEVVRSSPREPDDPVSRINEEMQRNSEPVGKQRVDVPPPHVMEEMQEKGVDTSGERIFRARRGGRQGDP